MRVNRKSNLPFVLKKMFVEKKQRAVLFLIKELGYTQREAQRFIARERLHVDGEIIKKPSQEIEGEIEFIMFEPITRGLQPTAEYEKFVSEELVSYVLRHQHLLSDQIKRASISSTIVVQW